MVTREEMLGKWSFTESGQTIDGVMRIEMVFEAAIFFNSRANLKFLELRVRSG